MANSNLDFFQNKFDKISRKEQKRAKGGGKIFWIKFFDWENDTYIEEPHRLRIK